MDDDELFASAWLKWGRAVVHARTLLAAVSAAAADPSTLGTLRNTAAHDPDRHVMIVTVADQFKTPAHWGTLLGDTLNNFRSALDHLAWALACNGTTPPDTLSEGKQRAIQFPIHPDPDDYDNSLARRLPGVTDAETLAYIRAFQPFPDSATADAIAVLHELNNFDKHRTVAPTLLYPTGVDYDVTSTHDCTTVDEVSQQTAVPLEQGAVLCRIKIVETGPEPSVTVDIKGSFAAGLPDHTALEPWIEATARLIAGLIVRFGFPPHEVGHLFNDYVTMRYTDEPGTPPWLPGYAP